MRLLSLIGLLAIVVGIAALVFFFGGFFNVSAQNEEPAPVKWALIKVRMAAVDRYATQAPPSGYDAEDKVQAGAKAYHRARLHQLPRRARVSSGRSSPKGCGPTRRTSPRSSRNASRVSCSGSSRTAST